MISRKHLFVTVVLMISACWLFGSICAVSAQEPKRGGVLKYGLSADPPNFEPQKVAGGTAAMVVKNQAYNGLLRFWKDYKIVPDLATSYETTDGGKVVTFKLHDNVYFHSGEKMTAEDVKFSFERMMTPETGSELCTQLVSIIEKTEVVDGTTVRFTLNAPSPAFIPMVASVNAKIVSKKFVEAGHNLAKEINGTGPFKLEEYTPAVSIKMVRNEKYFKDGLPYLDGIEFPFYKDGTTRVTALRTGAIDLMGYVPWKQMTAIDKDPKLQLLSDRGMLFMCAFINTANGPLSDPKVRQALSWAVERQTIVNNVFFGRGSTITGFAYPPSWPEYAEELDGTYGYDVEKAKKLLAEAGYKDGFKLTVVACHQYGMHKATGEILHAYFSELGLDVKMEMTDWATLIKRLENHQFDVLAFGSLLPYRDPTAMDKYITSSGYYPKAQGFGDETIDKLMVEGSFEMDPVKRKEIYTRVQKRFLELSPTLFLSWREQGEGAQPYVKGYFHIPGVYDSSRTLEMTWLDK